MRKYDRGIWACISMCNIIEELRNDIKEISDNDYFTTLVSSFFKVLYTHEKRRTLPQPLAQNVLQHGLLAFIALHLLLRGNP